MARLYVVAFEGNANPLERVWTLSFAPQECGWETDCGYGGYGLIKADADEIARRYNLLESSERDV